MHLLVLSCDPESADSGLQPRASPNSGRIPKIIWGYSQMPDRQMAKPSAKPGAPESTGGVEQKAVTDSHLSLLIED